MADTARHPEFPIEDWNKAPQYWGPGTLELQQYGSLTILDFERLEMLAEMQRDRGAFKSNNSNDALKAPIKVGVLPGSFVSVESLWEEDFSLHRPFQTEVFIVLNGVLEIERNRRARGILRQGDVVALRPGEVQLTAHGLGKRASSLALSILGLSARQEHFIVTQARYSVGREFDTGIKPTLPCEPEQE